MKKKLLASLLAVCLFVGLAIPAFAEDGKTPKENPTVEETKVVNPAVGTPNPNKNMISIPTIKGSNDITKLEVDGEVFNKAGECIYHDLDFNILADGSENDKYKDIGAQLGYNIETGEFTIELIGYNKFCDYIKVSNVKNAPDDLAPTKIHWYFVAHDAKGNVSGSMGSETEKLNAVQADMPVSVITTDWTELTEATTLATVTTVGAGTQLADITPVIKAGEVTIDLTKATDNTGEDATKQVYPNFSPNAASCPVWLGLKLEKPEGATDAELVNITEGAIDYYGDTGIFYVTVGEKTTETGVPSDKQSDYTRFVPLDGENNTEYMFTFKDGDNVISKQKLTVKVNGVEPTTATVTTVGAGTQLADITPDLATDGEVTIDLTTATKKTGEDAAAQRYPHFDSSKATCPVWLGLKLAKPDNAETIELWNCTEKLKDFYEDEIFYVTVGEKTTKNGHPSDTEADYDKFIPLEGENNTEYVFTFKDSDGKIISKQSLTVKVNGVEPKPVTPHTPSTPSYHYSSTGSTSYTPPVPEVTKTVSSNGDTLLNVEAPEVCEVMTTSGKTIATAKVVIDKEITDKATATNPVEIKTELPTDDVKSAIENSFTKQVEIKLTVPNAVSTDKNVSITDIKADKSIFEQAKASGKEVTLNVETDDGKLIASWSFDGSKIGNTAVDVNLAVNLKDASKVPAIKTAGADVATKPLIVSFNHSGKLPASAKVTLDVSDDYNNGEDLCLYYFNATTNKLELVSKGNKVVNGKVQIAISHCSNYVLTKTPIKGTSTTAPTTTTSVPMTSDTTPVSAVLLLAVMGGALALGRKKLCK